MATEVSIIQAILIAGIYWFRCTGFGYTFGITLFFSPLPTALLVGIILGNVPLAMTVGALIQLMYLGMIAPGGNMPTDPGLATLIAAVIVIKSGIAPEAAVPLAVPVGLLGAQLGNLQRAINVVWIHMADKYAETADTRGIYLAGVVYPQLAKIALSIPIALAVYFGPTYIQGILNAIPERLMHGLTVVGGMMPALGFAIVVTVIGRKYLLPYFMAGFFLVKYTGVAIMPLAIAGVIIAYLHILFTSNKNEGGDINAGTAS